jgi:hypothetical protein
MRTTTAKHNSWTDNTRTVAAVAAAANSRHAAGTAYFLGVSLMSNRLFSKSFARELANSLAPAPLLLVLADSLEEVNNRLIRRMRSEDAWVKALDVGEIYFKGFNKVSATAPNFYPVRTSDIEGLEEYRDVLAAVEGEFISDRTFRTAVRCEVRDNLGVRARNLIGRGPSYRLEEYVLREIAVSLYLHAYFGGDLIQLSVKRRSVMRNLSDYSRLLGRIGLAPKDLGYECIGEEGERAAA